MFNLANVKYTQVSKYGLSVWVATLNGRTLTQALSLQGARSQVMQLAQRAARSVPA